MSDPTPLKLLHLANSHSTNIGNGALILGTERVLGEDMGEDLGRPVAWTREPWDDYTFDLRTFDRAFVDRVNRETDGLIVGGAVAINGRHYLRNAGMRFDLPLELWPELRRPVVFYGLSHRHWRHQPFHHLDKLRRAIDCALSSERMLFSVRNDGTREWLEEMLGTRLDGLAVIPDPAMYVPVDTDAVYPELRDGRVNIMLAFNNEDTVYRYGGPGRLLASSLLGRFLAEKTVLKVGDALGRCRARQLTVVDGVVAAFDRLVRERPVNIVLVPHYFDDYQMISDFVGRCRPQLAHQHTVSTGLVPVSGTRAFYGRYARADLAVSMRVHSMSPSFGLGVPLVPLVTQERLWAFLRLAGIADLGVDAFAPDLGDKLHAAMTAALDNPASLRTRFAAARDRFRAESRVFHARVAALFG